MWINDHWGSVLTALGAGGGGGFLGKKLIDKKQDKELAKLDKRVSDVEQELKINTMEDKQFRSEFKEHKEDMKTFMTEIRGDVKEITRHLLSKK